LAGRIILAWHDQVNAALLDVYVIS